jgi:hypothetical protein
MLFHALNRRSFVHSIRVNFEVVYLVRQYRESLTSVIEVLAVVLDDRCAEIDLVGSEQPTSRALASNSVALARKIHCVSRSL